MAERSAFDQAMDFVFRWEGGLVNDPNDPGGLTKYGISQRAYPQLDIGSLTREQAREIYRSDYWQTLGLTHLPPVVAIVLMDSIVNLGSRRAVQLLQTAYNDLADGNHLAVDGVLGPITRRTVIGFTAGPDSARTMALTQRFLMRRVGRYARLAANPGLAGFLRGWIRRAAALGDYLVNLERRPL